MTGTPWQRVLVLVSAPLLVVAGGIATASAAPQRAGTGTNCASKAERNRISKGATRRTVRKIVGTAGSTLRRTGREVVRGYPTCRGEKTVVVTFRNGKVASVKTRSQLSAADIDGNGTTDYWFDANADGYFEVAALDTNGNGVFETFSIEGTSVQLIFGDQNENGYVEVVGVDSEKNGKLNWIVLDQNEDGVADLMSVDLVGSDGIADTWINATSAGSYSPPGLSATQSREVSDRMIQHTVTMQQLRQFDPWARNTYVRDGQTPSLLLPGGTPGRGCGPYCTP